MPWSSQLDLVACYHRHNISLLPSQPFDQETGKRLPRLGLSCHHPETLFQHVGNPGRKNWSSRNHDNEEEVKREDPTGIHSPEGMSAQRITEAEHFARQNRRIRWDVTISILRNSASGNHTAKPARFLFVDVDLPLSSDQNTSLWNPYSLGSVNMAIGHCSPCSCWESLAFPFLMKHC